MEVQFRVITMVETAAQTPAGLFRSNQHRYTRPNGREGNRSRDRAHGACHVDVEVAEAPRSGMMHLHYEMYVERIDGEGLIGFPGPDPRAGTRFVIQWPEIYLTHPLVAPYTPTRSSLHTHS